MPLFDPSSFKADWYGYATNQATHFLIGFAYVLVVTILNFSVFGEFPHKHHIFISGLSGYVIYEIVDQELNGWDTVEDIVFFGIYGVGGTLITASEITPGNPIAVVDVMALGAVFLVGFCHLSFGSLLRWLDARRS